LPSARNLSKSILKIFQNILPFFFQIIISFFSFTTLKLKKFRKLDFYFSAVSAISA
jgi:hypothetical protein